MREGFINPGYLLSVFGLGNWLDDATICQDEQNTMEEVILQG